MRNRELAEAIQEASQHAISSRGLLEFGAFIRPTVPQIIAALCDAERLKEALTRIQTIMVQSGDAYNHKSRDYAVWNIAATALKKQD